MNPPPGGRVNAPAAQEKVVISRSGNRCAYPLCGIELVLEALHDQDRPKAIGKVAHIAAASEGGPRYDSGMSTAQRGSASNLIYLCGAHHDAIDSQLELHTTEYLLAAKREHEAKVARALRAVMGQVTYAELSLVCQVLVSASSPPSGVELAMPVLDKIQLNQLGQGSAQRIRDGLSQAPRVGQFVEFQNQLKPDFGRALASRMKADYYSAIADGLNADEVFDFVVMEANENSGPTDSPQVQAAALSVVAYMFELCEIFEHA